MIQKEFFPNKTALVTLIAACLVVIISLGIRQTFGLFFFDFEVDLGCTQTEFGFAMGIQLFFWGLLGPIFGIFRLNSTPPTYQVLESSPRRVFERV